MSGVYLIKVNIKSFDNFWRADFDRALKAHWKEHFASHLQRLLNKRLSTELRAKAGGVLIEESYQAPSFEQIQ
jgi:hypothetical protein